MTFSGVVRNRCHVAQKVLSKHYGPKVDVLSVVVILYILLSGVAPIWVGIHLSFIN